MDVKDSNLRELPPEPNAFLSLIKNEDVSTIITSQEGLLSRLEKTSAMLQTVNELSNQRRDTLASQLVTSTRVLVSVKRELNLILKRTGYIKKILRMQYPVEYDIASLKLESAWKTDLDAERDDFTPAATSNFHPDMGSYAD
uniref:KxDL domain-containing protein n=1 Tax=Mesocestoides corti TaxID=53468 RepID=A0A5K3FW78_MESCO